MTFITEHHDLVMLIITAALTVFAGCFYGVREGMIMVIGGNARSVNMSTDGVRAHDWFRFYHFPIIGIPTVSRVLPMLIMYCLLQLNWTAFTVLFLLGILMIAWQCLEWFYSWTRYATWMPESENFLGHWRIYNTVLLAQMRICFPVGFITGLIVFWRLL